MNMTVSPETLSKTRRELNIREAALRDSAKANTYTSPEDVVECPLATLEQVYQNALKTAEDEFAYARAYIEHARNVRLAESVFAKT